MRIIIKNLVVVLLFLVALSSCGNKEVLDGQRDYVLIKAMESARNQSDENIDVEALEEHALAYEKNNEKGKCCIANALIGYKLFYEYNLINLLYILRKQNRILSIVILYLRLFMGSLCVIYQQQILYWL